MSDYFEHVVPALKRAAENGQLALLRRGIEKEGLRVDREGWISQVPHQRALGSKLTHPHITTDYSESLLEYVTPVFCRPADALGFLADLHRFTYRHIGDELVWPASMPARLDGNDSVPIADFGSSNSGRMKHVYRRGLDIRYGRIMQAIAGIHYNVSFPSALFTELAAIEGQGEIDFNRYRSEKYFRLIRNFKRHGWLLMYLFGASPAVDESFLDGREVPGLDVIGHSSRGSRYASSLRMSDLGYQNKVQDQLKVRFDTLTDYVGTLRHAVSTPWPDYQAQGVERQGEWHQLNDNILQIENEYYSDIRPKRVVRHHQTPTQALEAEGVEYIEVRCLDINPLLPVGIDETETRFIDLFLLFCLLDDDAIIDDDEQQRITENRRRVVSQGRAPGLELDTVEGPRPLAEVGETIFTGMRVLAGILDAMEEGTPHADALDELAPRLKDPTLTPAGKIYRALSEGNQDFVEWTLARANEQAEWFKASEGDQARFKCLADLVDTSWQQQRDMEEHDSMSFAEYLERYFELAEEVAEPRS